MVVKVVVGRTLFRDDAWNASGARRRANVRRVALALSLACCALLPTVRNLAPAQNVVGSHEAPRVQDSQSDAKSSLDDKERELMRKQLMVDAEGVQTRYPAVAKIVGRAESTIIDDSYASIPLYYGTGEYVAEYASWGIVVTNWHVVSESNKTITAIFPSGEYPARVILRDEKWDLAALIIPKPRNIRPLPISPKVPSLQTRLWVGGYGPTEGLDDFELHQGSLTNFVSLDVPKEVALHVETTLPDDDGVLYETEMIDVGVRSGDSGGPVFNEYGELVGCLWGSDKKSSMATNGARVALFLMEAIQEASAIRAAKIIDAEKDGGSPDAVVDPGRAPNQCRKASEKLSSYAEEDSFAIVRQIMRDDQTGVNRDDYNGLDIRGIGVRFYPVSSEPIYVSGNGVDTPEALRRLGKAKTDHVRESMLGYWSRNVGGLPPSPPIYSPGYLGLQVILDSDRPELISSDSFNALDERSRQTAEASRKASNPETDVRLVDASATRPVEIEEKSSVDAKPARVVAPANRATSAPRPLRHKADNVRIFPYPFSGKIRVSSGSCTGDSSVRLP